MNLFDEVFDDMFGNTLETARIDGEEAGRLLAKMFSEKLTSRELALQFVLEELDAARQGNEVSISFAENSGFEPSQYIGAMDKTSWEGDESTLEYIQLYFRKILLKIGDTDIIVRVSLSIVDSIMKGWRLGKYTEVE